MILPKFAYAVSVTLLASIPLCASPAAQPPLGRVDVTTAVVLWNPTAFGADSVDQQGYAAMAASMGFPVTKLNLRDLDSAKIDEHGLLLIPHASSALLSSKEAQKILRLLEKGLRLVIGGEGSILSDLRCRLGKPMKVSVVVDGVVPGNTLHWADQPSVGWISEYPDTASRVLYADSVTGRALAITAPSGEGQYIALASHLDPISGYGYSRFPTFVNAIARYLHCLPPFRRGAVHAYFDPGYRFAIPIDTLAEQWKDWGIRAVHVSAWYFDKTPPYDYRKVIDAAHRNGILVYAWLEWPHVGQEFWNRHPEWREKNALLQDARLDWLRPMDLQDPDCMRAALDDLSRLLAFDWDGIDIAEFTITGAGGEALQGASNPAGFTSFGPVMRREFAAVGGFDPIELVDSTSGHYWKRDSPGLDKFYEYRKVVNSRLLRQVVEHIRTLQNKGKRDWELIYTFVDNSLHPEFDRLFGFDIDSTLRLLREYGATLNVEDPYMEWDDPPLRYRHLRGTLRALVPERSSMIDINVVPFHSPGLSQFASAQQTGTELLQQLQAASERDGRVCVYCEWSVFHQDWLLVPYAMAAGSSVRGSENGWEVNVPSTAAFRINGGGVALNNGRPWPCRGPDGILLPAGFHRIVFAGTAGKGPTRLNPLRLEALSAELTDCKSTPGGFEVAYSSPSRCLVSLSARPERILVDGVPAWLTTVRGKNAFILIAPSGKHVLAVAGIQESIKTK